MSAFKRIFGRDEKFFVHLETSAAEAQVASGILSRLLEEISKGPVDATVGDVAQSRRRHKRISQEITEMLCRPFVTPLEREDIEELSSSLYKITKTVEKIAERLTICPPGADLSPLEKQVSLLVQATAVVVKMVASLRGRMHGEKIKEEYERLQAIETDADRVMNDLLRELYRGVAEARYVVFWKDICELLEKAVDRCRDAGSVVFRVTLKNS